MYLIHDRADEGGCGEPWNLDSIPHTEMMFADAVFDDQCQLLYDEEGDHSDDLYGASGWARCWHGTPCFQSVACCTSNHMRRGRSVPCHAAGDVNLVNGASAFALGPSGLCVPA
jgi:hypothetical protein